jgi:OOP family OmpA-OmpF porin
MTTNLLEMMSSSIGKQLVEQASGFLGASESNVKSAVSAALPTLLGGLMQKAATPSGASDLMRLLDTPELRRMPMNIGSYLGGGERTTSLLSLGSSLMSQLFGDKVGSLVSSIASSSGLKTSAASNLMALAAAMVLGFLKNLVRHRGLDANQLASMLACQSQFSKSRLGSRITSALGFASPTAFLSSLGGAARRAADVVRAGARRAAEGVGAGASRAAYAAGALGSAAASATGTAARAGQPAFMRWWPWATLGAIALVLVSQLSFRGQEATTLGEAARGATEAAADAAIATGGAARSEAAAVGTATDEGTKAGAAAAMKTMKMFELPNGTKIAAPEDGVIANFIAFLNSQDRAVGKAYSLDDVQFDTGSAALTSDSKRQLEQLATILNGYPAVAISVQGHTDSTGDPAVNKKLSAERAAAVRQALGALGVPQQRIVSVGYGAERSIASNDTEKGRARNRRVDVVVIKR